MRRRRREARFHAEDVRVGGIQEDYVRLYNGYDQDSRSKEDLHHLTLPYHATPCHPNQQIQDHDPQLGWH